MLHYQRITNIKVTEMPTGTICYCYLAKLWLQCPPRIPEDSRPTPQHPSALQAEKDAPSLARLEKIFAQSFPKDFNVEKHAQSLARLEKRLARALQSFLTSHAHDLKPCATRENPCATLRVGEWICLSWILFRWICCFPPISYICII